MGAWLVEVVCGVHVGVLELSQLATTAGLQPNPGLKCSGTVRKLVYTLIQLYHGTGYKKKIHNETNNVTACTFPFNSIWHINMTNIFAFNLYNRMLT